ncbi:phosphatase, partial [Salmonella enterica subsp. enterica]|nr:phosphatase [Salmonella enterica subsp. enterica]
DTPRLADVDFALYSLTQLSVAKQPNGDVVVLRKT